MPSLELELGRYDDPDHQRQADYKVDLCKNNLAIFGSAMSGKTTLIKTLLVRLHQRADAPEEEEVYILDFSNNLVLYRDLPCIVGYFDGSREEDVRRAFRRVEERLAENIKNLRGKVYAELSRDEMEAKNRPIHVTLILDGLNTFYGNERYRLYQDELLKLARDGLSKAVTVVVSAVDSSVGGGRLLNCFSRIIAFDIPQEKYADLFGCKVEKPPSMQGRGIANRDAAAYEFHAYYPYDSDLYPGDKGEEEALSTLNAELRKHRGNYEALQKRKILVFTDVLDEESWKRFCPHEPSFTPGFLTAGLDYYTFAPVTLELSTARCIAIYGRKSSGKTNLLRLLLRGARVIPGVRFVLWDDGRGELEQVKDLTEGASIVEVFHRQEFETVVREYFDLPDSIFNALEADNKGSRPVPVPKEKRPFTVFVVQSREAYQQVPGGSGRHLLVRIQPFIDSAASEKALFIFSDVQRIPAADIYSYFNYSIAQAFLLYDIADFVRDRGSGTVFSNMDQTELRERFGLCDQGDGFFYDLEKASIQKVKFIKDHATAP